jgi:hypothetical protein
MATETQVQWSSSNSVSVSSGSSQTSDAFTITDTTARILLKADNSTTPATDDQIYFWLIETSGDPDGTGTDEYSSAGHAELLAILDTNDEDPALKTVQLPLPHKSGKIYAEGSSAGTTNAITVSATITSA